MDRQSPSQFIGIIKAADVYISAAPALHLDIYPLLAMSAGSAVLSPADPAADFLLDEQTVLLFKQGDVEGLTGKLARLLDDPHAGRDMAQRGLDYIAEHHSLTAVVEAVTTIYRQATASRPKPRNITAR